MSNPVLRMALSCAERGWPVFPCLHDSKVPLTRHGYLDASTDPAQVREWFARHPHRNLAVATGAPGPDVLDIDYRGPAAHGFPALRRLRAAGLLDGAAQVRTPSGGRHVYFTGSAQRTSHLAAAHVDFLARGGYVLLPPSRVGGKPYQFAEATGGHGGLDWDAAAKILEPSRSHQRPAPQPPASPPGERLDALARWVAAQPEGNRNAGLYWAANRAIEHAGQAADLSPLAAAARQAGLTSKEITRTLSSARRTAQATPEPPGHHPEGAS